MRLRKSIARVAPTNVALRRTRSRATSYPSRSAVGALVLGLACLVGPPCAFPRESELQTTRAADHTVRSGLGARREAARMIQREKDREAGVLRVSWRHFSAATATSDAKTENGVAEVKLVASTYCRSRFTIDRLEYTKATGDFDFKRDPLATRAFAYLTSAGPMVAAKISKQFQGRGEAPTLVIGVRGREHIDVAFKIDYDLWPRKGYRLEGTVLQPRLPDPKQWKFVELRCGDKDE